MKTPEEIEKLAETSSELQEGTYTTQHKVTYKHGYKDGYTQCQQDNATQLSEWQLCPKCLGEGRVQGNGTTTSVFQNCDVCNGAKALIKPIIQPQQDNAERKYTEAEILNAIHSAELFHNENYSKIWEHVKLKLK